MATTIIKSGTAKFTGRKIQLVKVNGKIQWIIGMFMLLAMASCSMEDIKPANPRTAPTPETHFSIQAADGKTFTATIQTGVDGLQKTYTTTTGSISDGLVVAKGHELWVNVTSNKTMTVIVEGQKSPLVNGVTFKYLAQ